MAYEFVRKVVRVTSIDDMASDVVNDGDIIITKSKEVYIQADGEMIKLNQVDGGGSTNQQQNDTGNKPQDFDIMKHYFGMENSNLYLYVGSDGYLTFNTPDGFSHD